MIRNYQYVVFTNCKPGTDAAFNQWYDEVHLSDILAVPGFVGASRSSISPSGGIEPRFRYMAIYEMQTDDVEATLGEMMNRVASGQIAMTDVLEQEVELFLCETITPYRSA